MEHNFGIIKKREKEEVFSAFNKILMLVMNFAFAKRAHGCVLTIWLAWNIPHVFVKLPLFLAHRCTHVTRRDAVFVFPTVYFHVYPKIYKGNTTELSIQLCDPRFNPSKLVQGVVVAWRICTEIIGVRSSLYWELFYSRFIHFLFFFFNPLTRYKVKKKNGIITNEKYW